MAKEVDRDTFFKTRESRRHDDQLGVQAVREDDRRRVPVRRWNIYPFHFSDGDNWSVDDTHTCVELLKKEILPYVNLFCYGQVESPYGSGQFIKDLTEHFDEDERVVTQRDQGQGRDHGLHQGVPRQGEVTVALKRFPAYLRDIQEEIEGYAQELRPRLLPDPLRGPRLQDDERGRRVRRLPDALSALALRHGLRAARRRATSGACRRSTRW